MNGDLHSGGAVDPTAVANAAAGYADASATGREMWKSRFGFVMAAIGSAVGLGNMWRFPYITAEYGGAAFVLFYIVIAFAVGIPVLLAEFTIGRGTRKSSISALRAAGGKAWVPLGGLFVLTGFLILAYYSVIAGWVTRYALTGIFGGFPADTGEYFNRIASGPAAMGFHVFFMAATIAIVMGGVEKGIERANSVMIPALFLIVAGLAVWATTLSGSREGYAFYLAPNVSDLFNMKTLAAASSQAFFSLSLGMGAMLTFSSYLSRQANLPRESVTIALSDFSVAFLAGLVVFPVIFALGLQGAVGESTLGALFISLPGAFNEMGGVGRVVGVLFFVVLFLGAITSAISLLEVVVAAAMDEWGVSRKKASLVGGALIMLLGLWPAANLNALGALDAVTNFIFLPVGGLGMAILVGWLYKNPLEEVSQGVSERFQPFLKGWLWTLRIIVPILLVVVIYSGFGATVDAVKALFGG